MSQEQNVQPDSQSPVPSEHPPVANQQNSGDEPAAKPVAVPYDRFQAQVAKRKEAEAQLEAVIAEMVEEVPENFRTLIPELSAAEKAAWLRRAKASGLFMNPQFINSPDAARPLGKADDDTSGLTGAEKMKRAARKMQGK